MSSVMDIVSRLPPRVPEDLIIEIFLRLPAKSLLRFMFVCREWHKIIKNPSFEREHFHRGGEFTSHIAYFEYKCDFEIHDVLDEIALERYEVPDLSDVHSMHGPCNGIICVKHTNNTLSLWNPTTKRVRLLPTCPLLTSNSAIGFGSNPVTDDLKIVSFDSKCNQRQCAIYNSRNGAWNLLKSNVIFDPDYYVFSNFGSCAVLNGVCYWMKIDNCRKVDIAIKASVLAFDMRSDLFQNIELSEILQDYFLESTLHIIDDNLALLSYDSYSYDFEIWLMKEHGCWTKHSVVVLDFDITSPIRSWKRNQICTYNEMDQMIIYDLDSGNTRVIEFGRRIGSGTMLASPLLALVFYLMAIY